MNFGIFPQSFSKLQFQFFPIALLIILSSLGCTTLQIRKYGLKPIYNFLHAKKHSIIYNNNPSSALWLSSSNCSNISDQVSAVESECKNCVTTSLEQFMSGSDYYSNPKSQMGTWVDKAALTALMDVLDDTELNMESEFTEFCGRSPVPIIASLSNSEYFDINLIVLPFGTQTSSFTYAPGTLIFYRSLVSVQR